MKFKSLEISAIGPYPGKVTIPFDRLGGLSLVCGKTGSGKTFIFDAVTYALYGESSGDDRTVDGFRSSFASPNTESYVRLVFEHNGGTYTIVRTPSYMRPKNRGEGMTEEKATVHLDTPDGRSLVKKGAVDDEILDIIGLTAEQWRQVVMLAQGKFVAFLQATSEDRGKILESIFGIGVFSKMVDEFVERSKTAEREITDAGNRIIGVATGYNRDGKPDAKEYAEILGNPRDVVHADGRLFELIDRFETADKTALEGASSSENEAVASAVKAADAFNAAKAVNDAFDTQRDAKKAYDELVAEGPGYEKRAEDIKRARTVNLKVKPVVDERIRTSTVLTKAHEAAVKADGDLVSANSAVELSRSQLESATEAATGVIGIRDRASKINGTLESYDKVADAALKVKTAQDLVSKCTGDYESYVTEHARISEKVNGFRAYLSEHETAGVEMEHVSAEIRKTDDVLKAVSGLKSVMTRYDSASTVNAGAQADLKEVSGRAQKANDDLAAKRRAFIRGQAGSLSKELVEGEPCPVCGSVHHPSPAVYEDCPSRDELTAMEEKCGAVMSELDSVRVKAENASSDLAAAASELSARSEAVGLNLVPGDAGNRGVVKTFEDDVRARKNELLTQRKELEAVCSKIEDINGYFKKNNDPVAESQKVLDAKNQALNEAESALKVAQTEQSLHSEKLEFASRGDAEREMAALESRATALESAKAAAEKKHSEAVAALSAADAKAGSAHEAESDAKKAFDAADAAVTQVFSEFGIADMTAYLSSARTEEEISAAEAEVADYRSRLDVAKGGLESANKKVEGKVRPQNMEELQKAKVDAESGRDAAVSVRSAIESRIQANASVADNLRSMFARVKRDLRELIELQDLAEVAKGMKDANGVIIGFADYVRSKYFDTILEFTRDRLDHMTGGRYELRRVRDTSGGHMRTSHMLELEVIDHDAPGDSARPVSSLSGGESFKTALALALGFSDAIQEHASGQRIDALFVDEGFGSLDEDESLDQALDVLEDLSGSSKMVCVISHVTRLQEKIPRQIVVKNIPKKGSSVEILTD